LVYLKRIAVNENITRSRPCIVAGELGVGPTEGGEVMDFLNSLKADIVTA